MGGLLVEAYEEHGPESFRSFCQAEFHRNYLYNSGEGKIITLTEYEMWRNSEDACNEVIISLTITLGFVNCYNKLK